jgi:hypothetical protein
VRFRAILLIYMLVLIVVLTGVYLSESATNQLLGLGRSPQLVSLTPWESGGYQMQILGKRWMVDPTAIESRISRLIIQVKDAIWQQIEEIMAR